MKSSFVYFCLMMPGITGILSSCTKENASTATAIKTSITTTTTSLSAIAISSLAA